MSSEIVEDKARKYRVLYFLLRYKHYPINIHYILNHASDCLHSHQQRIEGNRFPICDFLERPPIAHLYIPLIKER